MENHPLYLHRVLLDPPLNREDTTFKPGLNVIWAQSTEQSPANSVGKTSLKDLIDFGLGKPGFLPKDKFELLSPLHNRTLVLMFSCHGRKYTLRRDLHPGELCVVLEGWIEGPPTENHPCVYRGDIEGYASWLEFAIWQGRNRPSDALKVPLRQVLALLARSQLHGFTGLEKGFESESQIEAQDRLTFLLGLNTPERVEARRRLAEATALVRANDSTPQVLEKFLAATKQAPEHEVDWKLGSLQDQLRNLDGQRQQLQDRLRLLREQELTALTVELTAAREQLEHTTGALATVEMRSRQYRLTRSEALMEIEKLNHLKQAKTILGPLRRDTTCPVCQGEISEELAQLLPESCPLRRGPSEQHAEPDIPAIEQRQVVLQYEVEDLDQAIQDLEIRATELRTLDEALRRGVRTLQDQISGLTREPTEQLVQVNDNLRRVDREVQLLERAKDLYEQRDRMIEQLKYYRSLKREAEQRLKEFEERERKRRLELAWYFDEIVTYLYRGKRRGALRGSSLRPEIRLVSEEGVDSGAATHPIATIAFDFALLEYALAVPEAEHPHLLIHDSPKQFEIDQHLYDRVFDLAARLEQDGKPFQYIITTLQVPVWVEAAEEHYIRKRLHGGDPSGKLFGFDY